MSGRIRSVKPEWLEDELLALASDAARVLSIGLMLLADDYGNGRANPLQLAGKVFPGKVLDVTANALEELRGMKFITLYEVDGQRYFAIRNWSKHQRVDKPGGNRVPFPPKETAVIAADSASTDKTPESPANLPGNPANLPASRGSDRGRDPGPDPLPVPGPEQPRDIRALASRALVDPHGTGLSPGDPTTWPEVKAIVAAFQITYGRADEPRHGQDVRVQAILTLLRDGYSAETLVLAVQHSRWADYMAKESNQSLKTILKDGASVDKYVAMTGPEQPRANSKTQPRQPNRGYDAAAHAEKI